MFVKGAAEKMASSGIRWRWLDTYRSRTRRPFRHHPSIAVTKQMATQNQ